MECQVDLSMAKLKFLRWWVGRCDYFGNGNNYKLIKREGECACSVVSVVASRHYKERALRAANFQYFRNKTITSFKVRMRADADGWRGHYQLCNNCYGTALSVDVVLVLHLCVEATCKKRKMDMKRGRRMCEVL